MAKDKADKESIIFAIEHCLLSDSTICKGCYQDGPGFLGITCKKNVIRDALELLKDDPLPVLNVGKYGIYFGDCPHCGKRVTKKNTSYCPYCGKAVKWDG